MSQNSSEFRKSQLWLTSKPFVLGACSAMFATCCIQPVDMVKVRIQVATEGGAVTNKPSVFGLIRGIIKNEGVLKLYSGLSAALLRQCTYGTTRLGIFKTLNDKVNSQRAAENKPVTLFDRIWTSVVAGSIGAAVGTPADVALVRMQTDAVMPPELRRNYRGVFHALISMFRESPASLFAGGIPTIVRGAFLCVGQLASFQIVKDIMLPNGPGSENKQKFSPVTAQLCASAAAAFFGSFFSLPFDMVKTRMQKQKVDPKTGLKPYANSIACAKFLFQQEGISAFWKGFPVYLVRIGPHGVIALNVLDLLNKVAKDYGY